MGYPHLHIALLGTLLVLGALWDVVFRRIPNGVSAPLAVAGFAAQWAAHGATGAFLGLIAGFLIIALLWIPWSSKAIGGGDLKLGAAAAIWVGLFNLPLYLVSAALAGGLASVACYLASATEARRQMGLNLRDVSLGNRLWGIALSGEGRVSVPYGAALAAGAFVTLAIAG